MDSPVRKMLKRNDYNRHKLLRKIKRKREAEKEQEQHAAEKELKRKLRKPKYDEGKNPYEYNFDSSAFDENGNLKSELEVTTPDVVVTGDAWRRLDAMDRLDRIYRRMILHSEIGPDGRHYPGHGALLQVSPEFDAITLAPLLKYAAKYAAAKAASSSRGLHFGKYYMNPQYDNFSYIRLVGDDAVEDMLRTGQMRTSDAIFDEQYARLVEEVGEEEAQNFVFGGIADLNANRTYNGFDFGAKTFNRNMFYTGRPFYGPTRTNYIITQPRPITKQKDLTKKGLEWIEDGHKGHTRQARAAAREEGLDPNTASGRIVDPVYNGDTNIIPLSEFGAFDLYLPMSAGRIKLPIYKKTSFNK